MYDLGNIGFSEEKSKKWGNSFGDEKVGRKIVNILRGQ